MIASVTPVCLDSDNLSSFWLFFFFFLLYRMQKLLVFDCSNVILSEMNDTAPSAFYLLLNVVFNCQKRNLILVR